MSDAPNKSDSTARLRLQGMAMLAVSLGIGVLIGVAGERLRAAASAPAPPSERFERGERGERGGLGQLPPPFEQIGLTDDQRVEIMAIMESRRARTESLMQQLLPPLAAQTDSVRAAIAELLTPEQQSLLDEAFASMGRRRGLDRPGRGFRRRFGPPRNREPREKGGT